MKIKQLSVEEAVARVPDGATLALTGSGGGLMEPDLVLDALGDRYRKTGHPCGLTIVHALGIGNGKGGGLGHFAQPGMVKRVIGGHWSWAPELQRMAKDGEIEAYTLPAGVISTLLREVGAGRPGVITPIGLGTFADPENGGGKCSPTASEDIVERIELDGRPYLRYKPIKIDVGILRGSRADLHGNISTADEPADMDAYAVALAAHNSGGFVIAQVKGIQEEPFVPARQVTVPGVMVDVLVHHPEQHQSYAGEYDPALSGQALPSSRSGCKEGPQGVRRIIAGLAARELRAGMTVNYGFGIPGGISAVSDPQVVSNCWEMVEQGIHNGELLDGALFGAARFPEAIVSSLEQFDFFAGGGLDIAFLGMGEMDAQGNVNVSQLGASVVGPGGFVEITQGARKVVFCGTFEAKGLSVAVKNGALEFISMGEIPKLVKQVRHVTFSGAEAVRRGQEVLYVTERAVFRLTADGVELVAVAKGVDAQRDVIERMEFQPVVGNLEEIVIRGE
ncbi:CoA-transferase [Nitrincola sp.]|uniref:CoA-transferase n=1 Tax=Nitrincola sp. TaxID=1926584 RepID=UPI003A917524